MAGAQRQEDTGEFLVILVFMFTFMVMLDQRLRLSFALMVGSVFQPLIGFDYRYPLLTLLGGGIMMSLFSIGTRHFFTDWVAMARNQKILSAFNKEIREARLKGQNSRMEKLLKQQKEITQQHMMQTSKQMKSMVITMLVLISIFTWLMMFVSAAPNSTFSIPWATNISLERKGPILGVAYIWIWVYSLVTIPLGQVVQRILKSISFKKRLAEMEADERWERDEEDGEREEG
ncbi:MAG: DUF106 domain-containing protein [Thermoplasmata archaeon]|nr:DUF106 domain-containing protein [Thermoplasmata archaeon]